MATGSEADVFGTSERPSLDVSAHGQTRAPPGADSLGRIGGNLCFALRCCSVSAPAIRRTNLADQQA